MLIASQKIGQWPDPLTPPESKTECNSWASGDFPWGGWKTCTGWATQWRHMEVEAFLDFSGPDNLGDDIKNAIGQCALVAAGAAGIVGALTEGAAAAAAAQGAFVKCLEFKGVEETDKYSISFRTASSWTDWH